MKTIFKKLIKDLFRDRLKFSLMIVATLLSFWGISTVMYGHWFTERDFEENFGSTSSADMIIYSDQLADADLQTLTERKEIAHIEKRGLISARIKDDEGDWMPLLLHIVEDFNEVQINRFTQKSASSVPVGALLIEQNGRYYLGETSLANIQLPKLGDFTMSIHGEVHDPRLPPSRMERMVYGYMTRQSLKEIYPNYQSGRFLVKTAQAYSESELTQIADDIKSNFTSYNSLSISIPEPNVHPHQNIVDALSLLQRWFGSIVALLGIILFSLVLLAWILPQVKEIGVMKALGANARDIQNAYFTLVLALSGCCLIPGLIMGYVSGDLYNRFIAFTQNFEVVEGGFPLTDNLLVIGMCLLFPLMVSYRPILKACRSSARETINQVFHPLSGRLFKLVQRVFKSIEGKYILNNLLRHGMRSCLILFLLMTGLSLLFMGINLSHSLKVDTNQYFESSAFQLSVYFPDDRTDSLSNGLVGAVKSYPIYRKSIFPLGEKLHHSFSLKYLPANYEFPATHILSGENIQGCSNCLWINQGLLPEFEEIDLGDILTFQDADGEIINLEFKGVIRELGVGGTMYTYLHDTVDFPFSELWLSFENPSSLDMEQKRNALEAYFQENNIPVSGIANNEQRLQMLRDHLKPTFVTIQAMGIFGIICGILGLGIMINIQLTERKGEIGLLRAIGSSQRRIVRIWLNEMLILDGIAIILGIILATLGAAKLCEIFGDTILHTPIQFFPNWYMVVALSIIIIGAKIIFVGPYLIKLMNKTAYERLNQGVE